MNKNSIHINNVETDELMVREMTNEEQEQRDADVLIFKAQIEARKAKEQSDAEAKADLLDRLGITADEAKLLLS